MVFRAALEGHVLLPQRLGSLGQDPLGLALPHRRHLLFLLEEVWASVCHAAMSPSLASGPCQRVFPCVTGALPSARRHRSCPRVWGFPAWCRGREKDLDWLSMSMLCPRPQGCLTWGTRCFPGEMMLIMELLPQERVRLLCCRHPNLGDLPSEQGMSPAGFGVPAGAVEPVSVHISGRCRLCCFNLRCPLGLACLKFRLGGKLLLCSSGSALVTGMFLLSLSRPPRTPSSNQVQVKPSLGAGWWGKEFP